MKNWRQNKSKAENLLGITMSVVKQVKLDISLYSFFHTVEDVSALAKSIDGPLAHEIDLGFGTVK